MMWTSPETPFPSLPWARTDPPPSGLTVNPVSGDLDHPEAVATDAEGRFLYAGGERGQIYRVDPATSEVTQIADVGRFVLGLALDAHGTILACAGDVVVRVDPEDGRSSVYCHRSTSGSFMLPNYCVLERDGHLLMSDSGDQSGTGVPGRIVRIPPGGGVAEDLALGSLAFPNGLALDDSRLYIAESGSGRISRVSTTGVTDVFALCSDGVIDGLALDREGGLVVSYFQPNRLERYDSAGVLTWLYEDPSGWSLLTPTNVAFYGATLDRLAIASLCGWTLSSTRAPIAGRRLNYPKLPDFREDRAT